MILGDVPGAGRYKQSDNTISGASHKPTDAHDTARSMGEFARWWQDGAPDPVLTSVVAHAWLTHIHPFADGNGRMARLLANVCLLQKDYPPLIVRAGSERGEYLDALAASDDGDILPLYELFTRVLGRTVEMMKRPDYVDEVINETLLSDIAQRHNFWLATLDDFLVALESALPSSWTLARQGLPDRQSFDLLVRRDAHGNSWCAKLMQGPAARWLLWYGYNHDALKTKKGWIGSGYPSLFFSPRDVGALSSRPYRPRFIEVDDVAELAMPFELVLRPGAAAIFRDGGGANEVSVLDAAHRVAAAATS